MSPLLPEISLAINKEGIFEVEKVPQEVVSTQTEPMKTEDKVSMWAWLLRIVGTQWQNFWLDENVLNMFDQNDLTSNSRLFKLLLYIIRVLKLMTSLLLILSNQKQLLRNRLITNCVVVVSAINFKKYLIFLSLDPPPPLYWEQMAEKRRVALAEVLDENEVVSINIVYLVYKNTDLC